MKRLFAVALGVLTAIGGFLDIGDLVTNAVVGSRFGWSLAWVVVVGVVGICLLAGGISHHEQTFRLEGTNSALSALVALAGLSLVLPTFTTSSPEGTYTLSQLVFVAASSLAPLAKSSKLVSVTRIRCAAMNSAPSRAPSSAFFRQHSHSSTAQEP